MGDLQGSKSQRNSKQTTFMRLGAPPAHGELSRNPLFRSNRPLAIGEIGERPLFLLSGRRESLGILLCRPLPRGTHIHPLVSFRNFK